MRPTSPGHSGLPTEGLGPIGASPSHPSRTSATLGWHTLDSMEHRGYLLKETMDRHLSPLLLMLLTALLVAACTARQTPTLTSQSTSSPSFTGASTVILGTTDEPGPTPQPQTPTSLPISKAAPSPTPPPATATPTSVHSTIARRPLAPAPTLTPAPVAERVLFAPGATQTTVKGRLTESDSKVYAMHVAAGQWVAADATVGTVGQGLRFSIVGADGVVVKPMGDAHVHAVVPSTQDYYLELMSDVGTVTYRLSVLIPVRINFAPGATSFEVTGTLAPDEVRHYVLQARAGQRMIVDPNTSRGQVRLIISGVDGQVLLSGRVGPPGGAYDGILPTAQDYLITVRAEGGSGADYGLGITIPPS